MSSSMIMARCKMAAVECGRHCHTSVRFSLEEAICVSQTPRLNGETCLPWL
jgi:hypothetical protein